jgi:hypothetical protein
MPKTMRATARLLRSDPRPATREKGADLLQALAAVEGRFTLGGQAAVPNGLLRDLVITVGAVAGQARRRLDHDAPAVVRFSELRVRSEPPPLPELDDILGGFLESQCARVWRTGPAARQAWDSRGWSTGWGRPS